MVQSRLEPSVEYQSIKILDDSDKHKDAVIYKVTINGIKLLIAIGNQKSVYSSKGVVYYPIYLIHNEKVISQIGVYEIKTDLSATIMGYDNDVDISQFHTPPLFYPFVNMSFLRKYETVFTDFEDGLDDDIKEEISTEGVSKKGEKQLEADTVVADTVVADVDEEIEPIEKDAPWIQKFFKNNKYTIDENEGNGDCLFFVVSSALASRGIQKSVADLRKILADNVTGDILQGYKTMYESIKNTILELKKEILSYKQELSALKKQFKITKDRVQAKIIVRQADALKKQSIETNLKLAETKENYKEFIFMKGINTEDELRAKIHTSEFWADTWAISTLERELNIKLILFSKEAYENDDLFNVLQCGQLNDTILEERGSFSPTFYILTNYLGLHYELIEYNKKKALDFKEIPLVIKNLVVEKCMERNSGPYYIIPNFREYMQKQNVSMTGEDLTAATPSDLYDNSVIFQFYSRSNKGPKPGKGSGEKISPDRIKDFIKLASIPDWRKKLSNFWKSPFELDGKRWQSVEHYYQGSKYKKNNPEVYNDFSLDSGSELSKDPIMAKGAGGKKGSYKGKRIIPKGVTIDPDFFKGRSDKTMEDGMMAKFSQNEDLKEMLLETHNAKLIHFVRGGPPVVFDDLMRVRTRLSEMQDS